MASTLTRRNADVSFKALSKGAADYIPKPSSMKELSGNQDFPRQLLGKIKALAEDRRSEKQSVRAAEPTAAHHGSMPSDKQSSVALRPLSRVRPSVLAVGSSTGGPQALFKLLSGLKDNLHIPVLITQHMPATFTTILAEHIARVSDLPCHEAIDGEEVLSRHIYVAPGDHHMEIDDREGTQRINLHTGPKENFCRPTVDVMLRSMASAYGAAVFVIMLTGMGHDGLEGSRTVIEAGGNVLAQDEASSVVWGMPGAVAEAGLCSAVLPLDEIPTLVRNLLNGRTHVS